MCCTPSNLHVKQEKDQKYQGDSSLQGKLTDHLCGVDVLVTMLRDSPALDVVQMMVFGPIVGILLGLCSHSECHRSYVVVLKRQECCRASACTDNSVWPCAEHHVGPSNLARHGSDNCQMAPTTLQKRKWKTLNGERSGYVGDQSTLMELRALDQMLESIWYLILVLFSPGSTFSKRSVEKLYKWLASQDAESVNHRWQRVRARPTAIWPGLN